VEETVKDWVAEKGWVAEAETGRVAEGEVEAEAEAVRG